MKLHVGCGRNHLDGYINLDIVPGEGVDVVADIQRETPLLADSFDYIFASHVVEHLHDPLSAMQELYRIAMPDCRLILQCPYGSSDDAWEDPTHVRPYFLTSFGYFSQPFYWRADYGYRGDWATEKIQLLLPKEFKGRSDTKELIEGRRNIVREMTVQLRAIKPIREPKVELQDAPKVNIIFEGN